jgi:HPt (histidine-containing phosphotransfer) domain-containing protein
VALTANALVGNDKMFEQKGFDGFISKPIDARQLDAVLNKFVRDRYPEESRKYKQETTQVEVLRVDAKVLQIFCGDAERAIAVLRETAANGDIKLYTTTVHAMKSALANVGEPEASSLASLLESAGQNGDMDYISANTDGFIETLEILIDKLRTAMPSRTDDIDADEDTAYLAEQLRIIKSACEDYDEKTAYAAFDRLNEKRWKPETAETLEKIRDMLFYSSDFDGAATMAGELIKESDRP